MLVFNFHHVESIFTHPERKDITITPEGLRNFIRTLRWLGIQIVSLRDNLNDRLYEKNENSLAILTFDDGFENNLLQALPVLTQEECPATIFVLPGRLAGTNDWDQGDLPIEQRDRLLSLKQMRELATSPWITLGSHGMLHRDFTQLNKEELAYEIHDSYRFLSHTFPQAFVPVLAYPWGRFSPAVLEAMSTSPYEFAMTVEKGQWLDNNRPYEVPRYTAFYRDGNHLILLLKLLKNKALTTRRNFKASACQAFIKSP